MENPKGKLVRSAFKCKKCGIIVESTHRHDYQECGCGNYIDGGLEYFRAGGNSDDMEFICEYEDCCVNEPC